MSDRINLREFVTKRGTKILAGKNDESNEKLIKQVDPSEEVFHTASPGSPFVNIKGISKRGDIKDAAIFCAIHSREWKKNKPKIVEVHKFKGKDIYKRKGMKTGTFGVKNVKIIKVNKRDIEDAIKENRKISGFNSPEIKIKQKNENNK